MGKRLALDYFYGDQAEQFVFYRIPKALFTDPYYKDISSDAKILYGLLLDRMSQIIGSMIKTACMLFLRLKK